MAFARLFPIDATDAQDGPFLRISLSDGTSYGSPWPQWPSFARSADPIEQRNRSRLPAGVSLIRGGGKERRAAVAAQKVVNPENHQKHAADPKDCQQAHIDCPSHLGRVF